MAHVKHLYLVLHVASTLALLENNEFENLCHMGFNLPSGPLFPPPFFLHPKRYITFLFHQEATIGTNIVSAVVAVIVLHLALGLFIYKVRPGCGKGAELILFIVVQAYFDGGRKDIKSD